MVNVTTGCSHVACTGLQSLQAKLGTNMRDGNSTSHQTYGPVCTPRQAQSPGATKTWGSVFPEPPAGKRVPGKRGRRVPCACKPESVSGKASTACSQPRLPTKSRESVFREGVSPGKKSAT